MSFTLFSQSDAKKYDIPGGTCYLYPDCPTGRLSCAYVLQDGRYPEEGFRKNSVCTEAMFIIDGRFTMTIDGETRELGPKDVVYVPVGAAYSIEGKGTTFVFIEPKWDSAQNVPA